MRRALLVVPGVLVGILLIAVAVVYGATTVRMRRTYVVDAPVPPIPTDPAAIARGRHLAHAVASCVTCHGDRLEGKVLAEDPLLGALYPSNLTAGRGGVGGTLTDVQWERAIRHGIGTDGRTLLMMPAETYQVMTDEDLAALVAYLRRLPPVDNAMRPSRLGPLGRALVLAGKAPFLTAERVQHDRRPAARIAPGVTPEYGYYLARLGGCIGCHRRDLSGGPVPGERPTAPPAPNLTPAGIGHYTEADFVRALRDGVRPDGRPLRPPMPVGATRQMTDDEARAILAYLRTVPPRASAAP